MPLKGQFQSSVHQNPVSGRRQSPNERQTELLIASPAGLGLAWFASLIGIAAMVRGPVSTVLGGINPWTQIINGTTYLISVASNVTHRYIKMLK